MNGDRRGFTLVELLVVAVLGAILLVATYKVLITNQRTYTAQNARIAGQQISRATMDVLAAELREINASDLISMGTEEVSFRAQRSFGLVCDLSLSSPPTLTISRVGDWFEVGDSVFVFADSQVNTQTDDEWILARVTSVDTTQTCNSNRAEKLTFGGQQAVFLADTVRAGAPVRSFTHHTYGRFDIGGESYIARKVAGGTIEPLVGPVPSTFASGVPTLEFIYMNGAGNVTTVASEVVQIEARIRVRSDARDAQGDMIADSLTTRAFLRN